MEFIFKYLFTYVWERGKRGREGGGEVVREPIYLCAESSQTVQNKKTRKQENKKQFKSKAHLGVVDEAADLGVERVEA